MVSDRSGALRLVPHEAWAQNVQDYRKDTHYSTKKGVKSAGRVAQSVRGEGWVEPISVRIRLTKCLGFTKSRFFYPEKCVEFFLNKGCLAGINHKSVVLAQKLFVFFKIFT